MIRSAVRHQPSGRARLRFAAPFALGTLLASAALAAVPQTVVSAGGDFGPDPKSSKHPKKALAELTIPKGFGGDDGQRLCASYERSSTLSSTKGSMTAKVEIVRDGETLDEISIPKANVAGGRSSSCTAASIELDAGDRLLWTLSFKKMPKIAAGDTMSFRGEVLGPEAPFGRFQVIGSDGAAAPFWVDGPHTVFCSTDAGFADLWIRFAADDAARGENAAHVDIDVCNYQGGGSHSPLDPSSPSCGGGKTFDIFWHDDTGNVFANGANASGCELVITDGGDSLEGAFGCPGLAELQGAGAVDILGGAFRCAVE